MSPMAGPAARGRRGHTKNRAPPCRKSITGSASGKTSRFVSSGNSFAAAVGGGRPRSSSWHGPRAQGETTMTVDALALPQVVSREDWLSARKALLAKEKELTHLRDAVAEQ